MLQAYCTLHTSTPQPLFKNSGSLCQRVCCRMQAAPCSHLDEPPAVSCPPEALAGGNKRHLCHIVTKHPAAKHSTVVHKQYHPHRHACGWPEHGTKVAGCACCVRPQGVLGGCVWHSCRCVHGNHTRLTQHVHTTFQQLVYVMESAEPSWFMVDDHNP